MIWMQGLLTLFILHIALATTSVTIYSNAQINSVNTSSKLVDLYAVNSQIECLCRCLNMSQCLTLTYIGINQTCSLFSVEVKKELLSVVVTSMNTQVIIIPNRTVTVTTTSMIPTTTATTIPICGTTCANTTTCTASWVAFYSFDSVTTDATGTYPATGIASPNYVTGWVNSAVNFSAANAQRFSVGKIPLNSRSFTIEFWFYATDVSAWDYAFMGEYLSQSTDNCLFINIRNQKLFIGFYADDLSGVTTIIVNQWYHAAFTYNSTSKQQSIYLNGKLESQRTAGGPFLGTSVPFTIGGARIGGSTSLDVYYSGIIDHVTISSQVKSACEIYLDANLACYFTFDSLSPSIVDSGPNFLTATNKGATNTTGRLNQALQFSSSSSSSYITINGISALNSIQNAFSISMWVNPTSISGGATLIHASTVSNGQGTCMVMWGLTANGMVSVNVVDGSNNAVPVTSSSVLSVNTWTHIVQTYSSTNGNRLYVNGVLIANVSATVAHPIGPYIFIGLSPVNTGSCMSGSIVAGQYSGSVDEFRVFGSELTAADICRLAYP